MNIFNSIKLTKPGKNVFDLSHDVKLSFNMGELVPIMCIETVPGDKFNISAESLLRFAPLRSPVMHRMDVSIHYFFVPNRIIWPQWDEYITNTKVGGVLPVHPTFNMWNGNYTRLADYMGIPNPLEAYIEKVSSLPFAAYQKIYNEYYRDQNLITAQTDILADGNLQSGTVLTECLTLRTRAWNHDYFTSALPFAQKGDPVSLPLGAFKDVKILINEASHPGGVSLDDMGANPNVVVVSGTPDTGQSISHLFADTSTLNQVAPTINDLRRAFRLQEWLEKNARAGTRYVENILAHFGVKSSDARLQRPEYITGTKSPVVISEVLNTSDTASAAQGQLAGHAISVTSGQRGSYYCEEHGHIIGIMSVMPQTAYHQGIAKRWLKTTDPTEYFWPSFANLGEQEIKQNELLAFRPNSGDVFGYIPRYAEYKFEPNRVAGDFRYSLAFWHLGRIFDTASPPALNQTFIECKPRHDIFAVVDPTVQKMYCHLFNKVKAVRSMPKYGTPTF